MNLTEKELTLFISFMADEFRVGKNIREAIKIAIKDCKGKISEDAELLLLRAYQDNF